MGNLRIPDSVQRLQNALYEKAKSEPDFAFYSLYDKICRPDVLLFAYRNCKQNDGSPGVDGQTFADIEKSGREEWLGSLATELRDKTYLPGNIRRVNIPKPNGKLRPLGIPNIRDRVVQQATVLVLGGIFETGLADEQYAYRDGKKALEAVERVHNSLFWDKRLEVLDADLTGYFDNIPHARLMQEVAKRTTDKAVLHLIKMWLEATVEELNKETGKIRKMTGNKDNHRGIPQGSPISPLLSNVYMCLFIKRWKTSGRERYYDSRIVNYADDLVICCRYRADTAIEDLRTFMGELGLTVNEEKTKMVYMPEGKFVFLGYEFRTLFSWKKRTKYIGIRPSQKAIKKLMVEVHNLTAANMGCKETSDVVKDLNQIVKGWAGYFKLGAVTKAYKIMDRYIIRRLRQWLGRKYKWKTKGYKGYPDERLYKETGLMNLLKLTRSYSWAKS
jgi:group II intron reverse transcriptase/maturase